MHIKGLLPGSQGLFQRRSTDQVDVKTNTDKREPTLTDLWKPSKDNQCRPGHMWVVSYCKNILGYGYQIQLIVD